MGLLSSPVFLVAVAVQALLGVKWLYGQIRLQAKREVAYDVQAKFVESLSVNHLPHIYHALRQIGERLDIELAEPPPIEYTRVKLNGSGK